MVTKKEALQVSAASALAIGAVGWITLHLTTPKTAIVVMTLSIFILAYMGMDPK